MFLCSKYTLRNVNDNEWQQFGWYNSSQAASHKISDIICTSFLILFFFWTFSFDVRCVNAWNDCWGGWGMFVVGNSGYPARRQSATVIHCVSSDKPKSNRSAFHFRFQILGEANSRTFPGQVTFLFIYWFIDLLIYWFIYVVIYLFIYFFFMFRASFLLDETFVLRAFGLKVG